MCTYYIYMRETIIKVRELKKKCLVHSVAKLDKYFF